MSMENANSSQIGGEHYSSKYQHWDFVTELGLSYIAGCATKYLVRWKNKNGIQDLEKAAHYVKKLMEISVGYEYTYLTPDSVKGLLVACGKLTEENECGPIESELIYLIVFGDSNNSWPVLHLAEMRLKAFIERESEKGDQDLC